MHYVYVIGPKHFGPYKIGIATDLASRLETLLSHSPVAPFVHGAWVVRDKFEAAAIENSAHRQFSGSHSHREWFNCELREVLAFIDANPLATRVQFVFKPSDKQKPWTKTAPAPKPASPRVRRGNPEALQRWRETQGR